MEGTGTRVGVKTDKLLIILGGRKYEGEEVRERRAVSSTLEDKVVNVGLGVGLWT